MTLRHICARTSCKYHENEFGELFSATDHHRGPAAQMRSNEDVAGHDWCCSYSGLKQVPFASHKGR